MSITVSITETVNYFQFNHYDY